MATERKVQVLPLPNGWWGLFIDGVLVRAFGTRGQAIGWACDQTL